MSANKDEAAVHGCSGYLHCTCLGEAGCTHACRFWSNRGVKYGWFVPFTFLQLSIGFVQVFQSIISDFFPTFFSSFPDSKLDNRLLKAKILIN